MFYFNKDQELDIKALTQFIEKFQIERQPILRKYKNYYLGSQDILNKKYTDPTKPCNKVVVNYCKNIVDSYCGYLATPSYISYQADEQILDVLRYNDYQTEDCDLLLDALIYGCSYELMYFDNQGQTRFTLIDPQTCFCIYEDSLNNDLLYFVRIYKQNQFDNDVFNVDVYSDYSVKRYTMTGGSLKFVEEFPHYFSQVPANVLLLPDEKSIFDCVLSLQDASNTILSGEIDDFSAFCDALLAITGADADSDDIKTMKENRVLILPEGAQASWLTKNSSDIQVENILKRIQDSIYRIAQCPDFSSESFVGGVSSGVAIKYRLTGMETRAGIIEGRMKKALLRRIEILLGVASLKLGEELLTDISIQFKRNIAEDINSTIALATSLRGLVSDKTILGMLPFVGDVDEELKLLEAQNSLYNFDDEE